MYCSGRFIPFIFCKNGRWKELLWKAAHRFRATGKGTIRILFDADKKYDQTVHILHDVNKHIKAIEGLYGAEQGNTAGEYAAEIRELLKPLIPVQYTENPILNILLTDKESVMKEKGISVTIKVDNVNLNFLAPIDITTIFGNLLDNAIEAAEKLEGGKYISIKIGSYHKW